MTERPDNANEALEARRSRLLGTFVKRVSRVDGVEKIIDVEGPDVDSQHFVFVITDGYDTYGHIVPNIVESIESLSFSEEERRILGGIPIFPNVGFADDYLNGVRSGGRPDTVAKELWSIAA